LLFLCELTGVEECLVPNKDLFVFQL